jgi:ribosomal protein S18 acetylase RimI-like enzyme
MPINLLPISFRTESCVLNNVMTKGVESTLNILPATWRDLNALQILEKQAFPIDVWPLWDLIGILTLPNIVRLKAVIDKQMVGFVAMEYKSKDPADWIATIGVLPTYQRCGIGMDLLEACEPLAKSRIIRLCVRSSNKTAQRLYLRCNYKVSEVWKKYYFDQEDALVMEKRLV